MYLWLEVPGGEASEEFAERLLEHGLIVSPGIVLRARPARATCGFALVPTPRSASARPTILEEVL